jgi:hypothetical protein
MHTASRIKPLPAEIVAELARGPAAAVALVGGVSRGNLAEIAEVLDVLRYGIHGFDARGFRAVARLPPLRPIFRRAFLEFWQQHGDGLRGASPSDFLLIDLPACRAAALFGPGPSPVPGRERTQSAAPDLRAIVDYGHHRR